MMIKNSGKHAVPKKVKDMAEYAYKFVPLYADMAKRNFLDEVEFGQLPVVGKEDYMHSKQSYLSTDYIGKYLSGDLLVRKTSGSTGKVTDYFWDVSDEKKSLMGLWYYRKKYYDISPRDKMAYFFPIETEDVEVTESEHVLGISKAFLYNGRLKEGYLKIFQYAPKWMILQPSVAWMLCEMIEEERLPVISSVAYLEFTGEYLEENVRRRAERLFHCTTANQYGTGEVNSIAYECPQRHMHIMSGNVYVEIINEKNGIGDICVTSLKNRAMPYIRYNTGDKGKMLEGKCACGNCNSVMEICNGRANDWVRKADNTVMHPFSLLQVINEVNARMNAIISQYQIIQREYDYFVFRLVIREEEEMERLEKMILCRLLCRGVPLPSAGVRALWSILRLMRLMSMISLISLVRLMKSFIFARQSQ